MFDWPITDTPQVDVIDRAMLLALQEAYKGAPWVSPNPLVGCAVIDKNENIISVGYHQNYGGPHAEVNALAQLSHEQLRGATVVVTLEPCAHEGKTPSCAKMLITKPIAQVIYGLVDPNPLVAGQGAKIIQEAGINCNQYAPLSSQTHSVALAVAKKNIEEIPQVCEVFLKNFMHKKIFIAAKLATTLDGFVAESNGHSQWITGSDSREYVHWLRACYDAVAVGADTFLKDNPKLNIRHKNFVKTNKVILFDRQLKALSKLAGSELLKAHTIENIFIVCEKAHRVLLEQKLQAAQLDLSDWENRFIFADQLSEAYEQLYKIGLRSVFLESGGGLLRSHLQEEWVDRLYLFQSNQILGQGIHWQRNGQFSLGLSQAPRLKYIKTLRFAQDILISGLL